jgi:hypothetical protein
MFFLSPVGPAGERKTACAVDNDVVDASSFTLEYLLKQLIFLKTLSY